ncbi:Ribosome biogenesis regulatory -like protein [Halotydeus destructor]|nr:Ribosome biogenesis regulatory -like protein [Halotydeus destructor]
MATNFIDDLLQQARNKEVESAKSVEVHKNVDIVFDLGHLLMTDPNELDTKKMRSNPETYLKDLSRDDVQLFMNKMWDLETTKVDGTIVAKLPAPEYRLPRSKPVPKPKELTKWQQFSKDKGISRKKKEKLVWDETTSTWKPRYGYNRIGATKDDWLIEVKGDPNVDQFAKKKNDRKERGAKNELHRLKNIARANKFSVSSFGTGANAVNPLATKEGMAHAVHQAKGSTASLGKFEPTLKNEKAPKNKGLKRHYEPNFGDMKSEKERNMEIIGQLGSKRPKIDIKKAMNAHINNEDKIRSDEKAGPGRRSNAGKKSSGGRGSKGRKQFKPKNQKARGISKSKMSKDSSSFKGRSSGKKGGR